MSLRPASSYVWVYRNIRNRKGPPLYSLMNHEGRVIDHRYRVLLTDCTFIVRQGGRARAIREQRKNVHAFVRGLLAGDEGAFGIDESGPNFPVKIGYNPYTMRTFRAWGTHGYVDGTEVKGAAGVLLNESGITACYVKYGERFTGLDK